MSGLQFFNPELVVKAKTTDSHRLYDLFAFHLVCTAASVEKRMCEPNILYGRIYYPAHNTELLLFPSHAAMLAGEAQVAYMPESKGGVCMENPGPGNPRRTVIVGYLLGYELVKNSVNSLNPASLPFYLKGINQEGGKQLLPIVVPVPEVLERFFKLN